LPINVKPEDLDDQVYENEQLNQMHQKYKSEQSNTKNYQIKNKREDTEPTPQFGIQDQLVTPSNLLEDMNNCVKRQ